MTQTSMGAGAHPDLRAEQVQLGYHDRVIVPELTLHIPPGSFTVLVGPNACGKSTLLRSLARLLPPAQGQVTLDGESIQNQSAKAVAKRLGLLPQTSVAPDGIRVVDLVSRGRYPHRGFLRGWTDADEAAVVQAMRATGVADLAPRLVDELSGGQRQRVWMATVLAQETPLMLLDEPTTFLDVAYQVEILDLCRRLNEAGNTIVAVLHDLNQASRYASHLVAMRTGEIIAQGPPNEIVTADLVRDVFGLECRVIVDPESATPLVIPVWAG